MPRPTRIEYEDAFYHVMNRGRARNNIFFKETHYLTFLKVLEETCERFDCTIHSYCLMPNHYHILVQTLHPNLSRAMKHINGIYTQRFNKLQKIDGPLFRGSKGVRSLLLGINPEAKNIHKPVLISIKRVFSSFYCI